VDATFSGITNQGTSVQSVAILFARRDSVYKTLPGCDVYDVDRDARTFQGGMPVVAHPPCRAWGSLSHFAKPRPGERRLAPWAVAIIRRNGGVLEHPGLSRVWKYCSLPAPGQRDKWGGFTLPIDQDWFGHRAEKHTRLYVVGCEPRDVPSFPIRLEDPPYVVSPNGKIRFGHPLWRPQMRTKERESTPIELAKWLVETARRCAHG
jgi:hypothetical protein